MTARPIRRNAQTPDRNGKIFYTSTTSLSHISKGTGNEIQLTDAIKRLMDIQAVYAYDFEGIRYDVGDKFGFIKATIDFALNREDLREQVQEYLRELVK